MIKKLSVSIVLSIILVFISLATLFGAGGWAGDFGHYLAGYNFKLFGVFAPILPLALIWILYLWCRGSLSNKLVIARIWGAGMVLAVLLCLQYLWFDKGALLGVGMRFLKPHIGFFGIYILLFFCLFLGWILCSAQNFISTLKKIAAALMIGAKSTLQGILWFLNFLGLVTRNFLSQRRRREKEENYCDFEPEPPTEHTQVPDVKDSDIRVFSPNPNLYQQEEQQEIHLVSGAQGSEIKDYSQRVLNRKPILEESQTISNLTSNPPEEPLSQEATHGKLAPLNDSTKESLPQEPSPQKSPKTPGKSSKNALLIHELEENKEHLESLEKGQIQKPSDYQLPSIEHLAKNPNPKGEIDEAQLDEKIQNLLSKLKMFRIEGDVVRTYSGPIVSTFEFKPASHVKVRSVLALSDDLAMELSAQTIRIQAPIPGKNVVGIEIPNAKFETIYMREILESEVFLNSASALTLALGKDIVGQPFVTDLKKLPHLLIAGTTGSGKSVGVNAMIVSLLYRNSPDHLKFIMIDPKMVEFSMYEDIPHLLTPIITDSKKAINALNSAVREMEQRYKLMSELKVKTIESYNQKCAKLGHNPFAYLVIIIDELADLMMTGGKEAEFPITRIAQMGRACGMHLIVATQRPSADVVTGIIKTNLPAKIAFKVSNKVDSRVVIDVEGAQSLIGRGDMLFTPPGASGVIRLHAPWISEKEIESIVTEIKEQRQSEYEEHFLLEEKELLTGSAVEISNATDDDDLQRAKEIFLMENKASVSMLQRRMNIGFNKASVIVENLEKEGFLSKPNNRGIREILG